MTAPLLRAALALAAAALAAPAAGGERPGTDLFAGYSFARIGGAHRHGGNVAAAFDLLGPVSAFVDAGGHWGSARGTDLDDITVMAGPGLRFGKRGGTVVFVRALSGLVRDRASIGILDVVISESRSGFGLLLGGGVDFPVARTLAVRGQADYLLWDAGEGEVSCLAIGCPPADGGWAGGFRASAGIVLRFGTAR